jgi:hypothetical protein
MAQHLQTLVAEMKKVHNQLLKRGNTVAYFQDQLDKSTFPPNLQQKLTSQLWANTIDESIAFQFNSAEQTAWISFKTNMLAKRIESLNENTT